MHEFSMTTSVVQQYLSDATSFVSTDYRPLWHCENELMSLHVYVVDQKTEKKKIVPVDLQINIRITLFCMYVYRLFIFITVR